MCRALDRQQRDIFSMVAKAATATSGCHCEFA
jgi:hypothetical protein